MADVRYHRVSPKFWSDPKVLGWDDDTRLLALYLLTCEHRTTEGLFRLPKQYVLADLEWSAERLAEPFHQLVADGFIEYDETAKVVMIAKALSYQSPSNPNGVKAALSALSTLPPTPLYRRFYGLAQQHCQRLHEALPEPLPEPLRDPPAPAPAPTTNKNLAPDKPARERDEIFDAIIDACRLDLSELTTPARGAINKAVKNLRDVGATPDGIKARADIHRQRWPGAECTPSSLAKNYAQLGVARPVSVGKGSPSEPPPRDADYLEGWTGKVVGQ